jgi:phospholipid N-methyltransferase
MEAQAIRIGICFSVSVVCVNNRQLKSLLARCKFSINGSFQNLEFVTLRVTSKAWDCVISGLPSLPAHQTIRRQ